MFQGVTLGHYLPGRSWIHRLEARTKVLALLVLVSALFLIESGPDYAAYAALTAWALAVARVPAGLLWQGLKPILFFLAITVLFNLLFTPGEAVAEWGPLRVTDAGVQLAVRMGLRLLLLLLLSLTVTLTTSPLALTDAIELLLSPFRRIGVPAHELAMMMGIALRFIPTLLEEAERIQKAQIARGAVFDQGAPWRRVRALLPLLVPLFVSAFRRADELALAMEARCYRGGEGRTRFRQSRFAARDGVALAGTAGFLVLLWVGLP